VALIDTQITGRSARRSLAGLMAFARAWLADDLLVRAAVGPVERLLTMLGEQRICALVYAAVFTLNLILCVTLIPRLGLEDAAISTSIALTVETTLLFWVTKIRLGLHVFILGRSVAR
jgi:O-antigen/teichoic acid export membrane protein